MNKFKSFCHKTNKYINKHSPELLLGTAIAGFITTVIMVAKEAPVAKEKLDKLHDTTEFHELSKPKKVFEEVKAVTPVYAPAVVTGTISIGCALGSYKVNARRVAAWMTACEIAQTNLKEFKTKVVEEVGEKAVEKIQHDIVQDHLDNSEPPVERGSDVIMTGKSLYCIDYNKRYFYATRDNVWEAVKKISERLIGGEDWISLYEFLWELDIRQFGKDDEIVGFNSEDGINIYFDSGLTPTGEACAVIKFVDDPMPCKYR